MGKQIIFFKSLRMSPNEMGGKNENKRVASSESVPIKFFSLRKDPLFGVCVGGVGGSTKTPKLAPT